MRQTGPDNGTGVIITEYYECDFELSEAPWIQEKAAQAARNGKPLSSLAGYYWTDEDRPDERNGPYATENDASWAWAQATVKRENYEEARRC